MNIPSFKTLPEIFQEPPSNEAPTGRAADTEGEFSYLDNITETDIDFVSLDTYLHANDTKDYSWSKVGHLTIDKDDSVLSLPSLPALSVSNVLPIPQSNKKRQRHTPELLKKTMKKKKKKKKKQPKERKVKSAFSSLTCVTKTPKYVVRCGDDPPRYGVKMKLCNQNVRIGCNYIDMCSAAHVALEAKKLIILTSSNIFKLRENNNNKSMVRVSVYIQGKVVQRSVHWILRDFISVFNAKRSWKSADVLKERSTVSTSSSLMEEEQEFETELSKIKYVEDFPTKIKKLRDGYVKDLACMYTNLGKARLILVKAINRYESEGHVDGEIAAILELLKKSANDIGDLEKALREGTRFNASILGGGRC